MPDTKPELQAGVGFHLQPSGQWAPEEIPPDVLHEAGFSGHLTIQNYRCVVFETESGDQWAQKIIGNAESAAISSKVSSMSTKISPTASRIAARYLESKKNDLISQVNEVFDDERGDTEYNDAIVNYCDSSFATLESLNEMLEECADQFTKASQELAVHKHEKVQNIFAGKMQKALMDAGVSIREAGNKAITEIVKDLKILKDDASRRG